MNLKLLIALAAGVGALVGPQPQLKKVQSLSFAPALKTWVEEKCRGGTCGVVPVASMWRYSGDAPGKEGFVSSSDGRAIAASWGPAVKNAAE